MRSRLGESSFLDHEQPRRAPQGRQPVRDREDRAPRDQSFERLLDLPLRLRIDAARRLVENENARIVQDRARDRNALSLAARERVSPLADDGVVTLSQLADEVVCISRLGRRNHRT